MSKQFNSTRSEVIATIQLKLVRNQYEKALEKTTMKKTLTAAFLIIALSFMPLRSAADEAEAKRQIEGVAASLLEILPRGKKIILKTLSPDETGLPEDFLRKLTSDIEAAFLLKSDFKINLSNRNTTEDLWSEAIEFGDAEFEQLYQASKAEIMLMLAPRVTSAGLEISITAYQLIGDEAGKVLAASGSVNLAIDVEGDLGIDVNTIDDRVKSITEEIERLSFINDLIKEPVDFAGFYHNYKINAKKITFRKH